MLKWPVPIECKRGCLGMSADSIFSLNLVSSSCALMRCRSRSVFITTILCVRTPATALRLAKNFGSFVVGLFFACFEEFGSDYHTTSAWLPFAWHEITALKVCGNVIGSLDGFKRMNHEHHVVAFMGGRQSVNEPCEASFFCSRLSFKKNPRPFRPNRERLHDEKFCLWSDVNHKRN